MKGTLTKTEQGWRVQYGTINSIRSLPLHPENESIFITYTDYSIDWDGKEVDFEIVNIVSNKNTLSDDDNVLMGIYAKLIKSDHISDISKMVDKLPTTTSDLIDSAIWSLPFEERMKCWDLIEKLVDESLLPQQEISDEEIEKAKENAWSDYEYQEGNLYSTTFSDGWKMAIRWYREQLKK